MGNFKRILLTGLFIVIPFTLTFVLLSWFVYLVDSTLAPVITGFVGRPVAGAGLITALLIVFVVGAVGSNLAGQHLFEFFEEIMMKIPVFNSVYKTVKQLTDVFSPASHKNFRGVVLIEYPRPGVYSMGFVTNKIVLEKDSGEEEVLCIYVPTNHFYVGDYVMVPSHKAHRFGITQQEGIQAAVSAGASLPPRLRLRPAVPRVVEKEKDSPESKPIGD